MISSRTREFLTLSALTLGALLVHGYHPAVEDAEIYLPGIFKLLHPSLFPYDAVFFQSHAGMTLFPHLIAGSVWLTHLPAGIALLGWHVLCVFLLLLACWRIARLCFRERQAAWCGVALVGCLLTMPVAGTALYIMDQYLSSRSLSTPAGLFAVASALEGNYLGAGLWIVLTAAVHPLMAVFAAVYVVLLVAWKRRRPAAAWLPALLMGSLFPPVTPAYRVALSAHPYFSLANWSWYEWLGILAPFALLAGMGRVARRHKLGPMDTACRALVVFEAIFLAAALVICLPGRFENLLEIQPMRCLHLLYILLFLFAGGLAGRFVLRNRAWRWALLFVPLCAGMWFAQRQLFPATPHLEWPWLASGNPWDQAFDWIRRNTPEDAYFALDPDHEALPEEDFHGFRAMAQRSMLADAGKDGGAVSMFPALADRWVEQVAAQRGWKNFRLADFQRLKRRYGVNWVVVEQPGVTGFVCPYQNSRVLVCPIQ